MNYTLEQLSQMDIRTFKFVAEIHGYCGRTDCPYEREKYNRRIKPKCYSDYPNGYWVGQRVNPITY